MELVEQKKHEYHYIGSQRKIAGCTLFSFNTITRELKIANITKCKVFDMAKMAAAHNDKVAVEKNCIYLQALNKKNALRHLRRMGYEV